MTRLSTSQFTWSAEDRTFAAFLSDLPDLEFSRIYPDACDVGLELMSSETGKIAKYVCNECGQVGRNSEGEVQFVELLPAPETVRSIPTLQGTRIMLFND